MAKSTVFLLLILIPIYIYSQDAPSNLPPKGEAAANRESIGELTSEASPFGGRLEGAFRGVVADMDMHTPLRDVAIHTDRNQTARTNYRGEFTLSGEFTEVTFGRTGFLPRKLSRDSLLVADTVFLLPRMSELDEVVVIGKAPQAGFDVEEAARQGAAMAAPSGGISFDFASLFDFRGRRHARRRKRLEKIFENYDRADDPLLNPPKQRP